MYRIVYYQDDNIHGTEEGQELSFFDNVFEAGTAVLEHKTQYGNFETEANIVEVRRTDNDLNHAEITLEHSLCQFIFKSNILKSLLEKDIPWQTIKRFAYREG